MKKSLAKAVLMSLVCASYISVCYANIHTITSSCEFTDSAVWLSDSPHQLSNPVAITVTDSNTSNDDIVITFRDEDDFGCVQLAATGRSEFLNQATNQKVILEGSRLQMIDYTEEGTALQNIGKELTVNNMIDIDGFPFDGTNKCIKAVSNSSTINFNNYVFLNTNNVLNSTVEPTVKNIGTMNINSAFYISNDTYVIDGFGGGYYSHDGSVAIVNEGILNIAHNKKSDNKVWDSANMENLVDDEHCSIFGDVVTKNGGITNIVLGGIYDYDNVDFGNINEAVFPIGGSLEGAVIVEDGATFNLTIKEDGVWLVSNRQSDVIDGLTLNGGIVTLGAERSDIWDGGYKTFFPSYDENKWCTLKLTNLKSNGDFSALSGFTVHTDLARDIGDKIEFISLHKDNPKLNVPVYIDDKIYENWWNDSTQQYDVNVEDLISPEEGHSVTIATSPVNSGLSIKTDMATYKEDNKVYKTVVNEEIVDGWRNWNFVGWEATGEDRTDNSTKKEITGQHSEGTDIMQIDTDNTFKRLNELRRDIRTDPSEVGVWMRGETGETKIGSYSYDYNLMSGGYDWHKENEAGILFTGVGFSYATNDCDDAVIGDTKSYGMNLYGSWYGKAKNEYVDLILRYGKLDKEYAGLDRNGVFVSGDYDKDMFSIAAKYGRRIYKDDWYWEPSVGLTWGRVGSADFIDNLGTNIHADSTNSLITSLGMQVGKNIKGIEYYGKAEVMHDFDGNIRVTAPGLVAEDDMGGTWLKCAIGASRKIDENNSFYLEVERDFGNKVEKPYGFSAGYRFTW